MPCSPRLPWLLIAGLLLTSSPFGTATAGPPKAGPSPSSPSQVLAAMVPVQGGAVSMPPPRGVLEPGDDQSLAPYLAVSGPDGETERLPLRQTSADVAIVGVIARVTVSQLYENDGQKPIEAIYVFPASTRAAVHGMRMKIGTRVLTAKIERQKVARQEYEQARQEGRRASLLEQQRPNVFTMNVANVMPGDKIAVELEYSELLVPDEGVYEFVYPTVVGPRYGGGADPGRDRWIANPYLPQGSAAVTSFQLSGYIDAGIDLKELSSPSHKVKVSYQTPRRAQLRLEDGQQDAGNRDFILRYRLAGDRIETGVLLWEGEGAGGQTERHFAVLVEPPPRPNPGQVPPREYIFLLDVSGSMHGFPLETAKALMRKLLSGLRPIDSFNVVLFSGASFTLAAQGSLPASAGNLARAMAVVEQQQGGGGTELLAGLEACYRIPRPRGHVSRTVVVVTDGFVGVEPQTFRLVRERLSEANLFAFGIGSSVNRGLIEGMARAGQGEPFVVLGPERAARAAEQLRAYIEQPVLTGVEVKWNGFAATEVAPARQPDLLARRPLVIFGKYQGPASGRIDVSGWQGAGAARFHQSIQIRPSDVRKENAPLRWLWARKWVDILDDERHLGGGTGAGTGAGTAAEEAITQLGLGHHLLTSFTSFVAVDSQRVNAGGSSTSVKQPLPLPEGVSNFAVGHARLRGVGAVGGRAANKAGEVGGLSLIGSGVQGLSATASPPPAMPAASARANRAEALDADLARQEEESAVAAAREPDPALQVRALARQGVGSAEGLLTRVRLALAGRQGGCGLGAGATVHLRLMVDRAGKVLRVDLVRGDARRVQCLRRVLVGLTSSTRASGAGGGTVELRIGALAPASR